MRIIRCKEKGLEETHFLLKWGEDEIPKVAGIEAIDVGMSNTLAFPIQHQARVMRQNPSIVIASSQGDAPDEDVLADAERLGITGETEDKIIEATIYAYGEWVERRIKELKER